MVTVRGWQVLVADPVAELDDLAALSAYAESVGWRGPGPGADGPPFAGGAVGHLTDDLSAGLLALPADDRPPARVGPPLRFGVHDWALAVAPDGQVWFSGAPGRFESCRAMAAQSPPAPGMPSPAPGVATATLDRRAHAAAVARALDWIAAGDLYQLNLTLQLLAGWRQTPEAFARRLFAASPEAPHGAWLTLPTGESVVSVSPETFLRVDHDTVTTRPIKGTRPRGATPAGDDRRRRELEASAKDRAEHVMIVDLERNDLGRVCVDGSVEVAAMAATEAHPTVWHLTSTIAGTLASGVTLADLVTATFPCGSVTGAPKRRAVERIRRLEPVRRGVYCGAIGVVGPGIVDLSVAIRTAVLHGDEAAYGTGGGIVADSDPGAEWDEAMDKAAAFLTAVNARPPGR